MNRYESRCLFIEIDNLNIAEYCDKLLKLKEKPEKGVNADVD